MAGFQRGSVLLVVVLVVASQLLGTAQAVKGIKSVTGQEVSLSFPPFTSALNCSYDASVGLPADAICTPSNPPGTIIFSDDNDVISVRYQYIKKVPFYKKGSKYAASFSTSFTINFKRDSERSVRRVFGGGIAFAITPTSSPGNSGRESLGLFEIDPATGKSLAGSKSRTVAVELDTSREVNDWDPQIPHVGLDINSVDSVVSKYLGNGTKFIDRKVGVFIDYDVRKEVLEVRIHKVKVDKTPKKKKATLLISYRGFDLSKYVNDFSYVGFSSRVPVTTDGVYILYDWKFSTKWFLTNKLYH